jgi:gamma-glutamyltranspeptidase / glutathione hydrolase
MRGTFDKVMSTCRPDVIMKPKSLSLLSRAAVLPAVLILCGGGLSIAGADRQAPAPSQAAAPPPMSYAPRGGEGTMGVVSSAHPLATEAGLEILRDGGNAFDAAVAVAAALNVVEPAMSGMGGYGTILVWDAKREAIRYLNASGRIPATVNADVFRAPTPDFEANRRGAKAVSTPGNVHAWEALVKDLGRLKWAQVLAPAIRLAEQGFALDGPGAAVIAGAYASFPEHAKAIYGRGGLPLTAGETLVQRDLAQSLRLVSVRGASAFYSGDISTAIDRSMRTAGGFLAYADLKRDKAEWRDGILFDYRGYKVYTAAPPANAFDYLVRLGLMSRFDMAALGHNSVAYLHRFAEATKQGFWVRLKYAGDPDVAPPPVEDLLGEPYLAKQAGLIDLKRATPFVPPGGAAPSGGDTHTTHFVVADRWGNVVSATQTLGNAFGSRIMPEGTGIWLNDSLAYSTFEPKGNPMDAHPGRHKLSGDCPTIIMRNGRAWAALGSPGGHTIGQTVPQMVMNLVDFGMSIEEALAAPRISFVEPDVLAVEEGIPPAVRDALAAMGHRVRVVRALGNAHGLTIQYDSEGKPVRFRGASDPRGAGKAGGY